VISDSTVPSDVPRIKEDTLPEDERSYVTPKEVEEDEMNPWPVFIAVLIALIITVATMFL
jgi:hypothetical protein